MTFQRKPDDMPERIFHLLLGWMALCGVGAIGAAWVGLDMLAGVLFAAMLWVRDMEQSARTHAKERADLAEKLVRARLELCALRAHDVQEAVANVKELEHEIDSGRLF